MVGESYTDAVLTVKCQAAALHEDALVHYYKSDSEYHAEEFVKRVGELKKAIEYFERENAKRKETTQ